MSTHQTATRFDDLTLFEVSMAEQTAGIAMTALEDPTIPKIRLLAALAWVIAKREDPKLKFDDFQKVTPYRGIVARLFGVPEDQGDDVDANAEGVALAEPVPVAAGVVPDYEPAGAGFLDGDPSRADGAAGAAGGPVVSRDGLG